MPVSAEDMMELKADVAFVKQVIPRMDAAIERMTEVASTVSKLLAVHESKLEYQDKAYTSLMDNIEKRRTEMDNRTADLHEKINTVKDHFEEEISTTKESFTRSIEESNRTVLSRLSKIEKWIWLVSGGGVAIGWVISQIIASITGGHASALHVPGLH